MNRLTPGRALLGGCDRFDFWLRLSAHDASLQTFPYSFVNQSLAYVSSVDKNELFPSAGDGFKADKAGQQVIPLFVSHLPYSGKRPISSEKGSESHGSAGALGQGEDFFPGDAVQQSKHQSLVGQRQGSHGIAYFLQIQGRREPLLSSVKRGVAF